MGFGRDDSIKSLFISAAGNQTIKRNSVGYAFNYYLNHIKTSQATGTISLQLANYNSLVKMICLQVEFVMNSGPVASLRSTAIRIFNMELIFLPDGLGKRGKPTVDQIYPSRNG